MLKDNIKNAKTYYNVSKRIEIGLKYLENTDFSKVKSGKYEVLGKEVFAIVQDYLSKPKNDAKFEAHRKYIDIQYIIEGEEQMGFSNIDNFTDLAAYDEEKDIVFLTQKPNTISEFIKVKENEFVIFSSTDAHMPSIAINNPKYVKKVVVKVFI